MLKACRMSIQIPNPEGFELKFNSWDQVIKFLQSESAHWEWLANTENPANVSNHVRNDWAQANVAAQNLRNQGLPLERAPEAFGAITSGQIFPHDSVMGGRLLEIRSEVGESEAAWAYAFVRQMIQLSQISTMTGLRGVMALSFPENIDATGIADRLQKERQSYRSAMKSAAVALTRDRERSAAKWADLRKREIAFGLRQLRHEQDLWSRAQKEISNKAAQSIADVKAVESTYTQFMKLKAPVEYWRTKSGDHATARSNALGHVKWFFGLFIAVMVALFVAAGFLIANLHDPNATREPVALYVMISAGLVVASTVGFWIGRILTKLYLSEHHLKTDADERAVMTETYLALTQDTETSDAEKQIILAALFRNTTDGIVKDDGPVDISIPALLARLATAK